VNSELEAKSRPSEWTPAASLRALRPTRGLLFFDSQRHNAKHRKARHRARVKRGVVVLKVEVCETDLIEAMLRAARISPQAALDRGTVEAEAASILKGWVASWLQRSCVVTPEQK
jgi:hypothetical protein